MTNSAPDKKQIQVAIAFLRASVKELKQHSKWKVISPGARLASPHEAQALLAVIEHLKGLL